jgi:glycosyltransferase involved in cell wall biosynthesis
MTSVCLYIVNYNYKDYLECAIDSVLNQDFSPDHVLLIDNGSSDGSKEIGREIARANNWEFINTNRLTLGQIGNIVLENTSCDYIMRLDADDILESDYVSTFKSVAIESIGVGAITCDYQYMSVNGDRLGEYRIVPRGLTEKGHLYDEPFHGACTWLNRKCMLRAGGYLEFNRRQDGFDAYLMVADFGVKHIDKPLFLYRRGHRSLSSDNSMIIRQRLEILEARVKLVPYCVTYVLPSGVKLTQEIYSKILDYSDFLKRLEKIYIVCASSDIQGKEVLVTEPPYEFMDIVADNETDVISAFIDLEQPVCTSDYITAGIRLASFTGMPYLFSGLRFGTANLTGTVNGAVLKPKFATSDTDRVVVHVGGVCVKNVGIPANSELVGGVLEVSLGDLNYF